MPLRLSVEYFTTGTISPVNALYSVAKEQGHYTIFTRDNLSLFADNVAPKLVPTAGAHWARFGGYPSHG